MDQGSLAALDALADSLRRDPGARQTLRLLLDALEALLVRTQPDAPDQEGAPPGERSASEHGSAEALEDLASKLDEGLGTSLSAARNVTLPPAASALTPSPAPSPRPEPASDGPDRLRATADQARLIARLCREVARGKDTTDALVARLLEDAEAAGLSDPWPYSGVALQVSSEQFALAAGVYENFARALLLGLHWEAADEAGHRPPKHVEIELAAEAQSALRVLWGELRLDRRVAPECPQQVEAFIWLRRLTEVRRVYVERFLRLEHPAAPGAHRDLQRRLEELEQRYEEIARRERRSGELEDDLRNLAKRLAKASSERFEGLWLRIFKTLEEWREVGNPPSDLRVRDPLVGLLERLPPELEPPLAVVETLRAVEERERRDRELEAESQAISEQHRELAEPARRLAELLTDRVVVMVGGELRPRERRRLEDDLRLRELRWITPGAHKSLEPIHEAIRRPEVSLVVQMVRFGDHALAELRVTAEQCDIPFVRLLAGYGTNRFAHDVLNQAGDRLGA